MHRLADAGRARASWWSCPSRPLWSPRFSTPFTNRPAPARPSILTDREVLTTEISGRFDRFCWRIYPRQKPFAISKVWAFSRWKSLRRHAGHRHADAVRFMEHPELIDQFMETIKNTGWTSPPWPATATPSTRTRRSPPLTTSSLSGHLPGRKIGVRTVVGFSGCPGDCRNLSVSQLVGGQLAGGLPENPRLAVE